MKSGAEKIKALRALIKQEGLDGFIIPKADEYQGEFVPPFAERLKWLTGFTGSAGIAVVLDDKACVLTDGRYTLQVSAQVDTQIYEVGDSIELGVHGWLKEHAPDGAVIGYDPWLHTPDQLKKITDEVPEVELRPVAENLIDKIWNDQPPKPNNPVQKFSDKIAGMSLGEKKKQIAAAVQKENAQAVILTLPDSVSWLLNVRGSDIECTPAVLSYAIVYADESRPVGWIAGQREIEGSLGDEVELVTLDAVAAFKEGAVMLDHARAPSWFKTTLEEQGVEVINAKDPCIDLKAIKTPSEFEAIKRAHVLDGAALCKFLHWLQQQNGITELDAQEKLQEFRTQSSAYRQNSFPTICGFGSNGAIVHYRASETTNKTLEEGSLLLVDSGGQYYEGEIAGTTDITRTVTIGEPTEEMRQRFTLVLKGHIALASARFPVSRTGKDIDAMARQPLWNEELDYAHGTGHGVGCYLAVHEEATSISTRGKATFKQGMLISNEPGYYKENEYGIRTENLVFVKEAGQCEERGKPMLAFETVSLAPIDRCLIVTDMLSDEEIKWLNEYHSQVYDRLKNLLEQEEAAWLEEQTQPL